MILKKLKLKNIRSYKEQEIEFPEGSLLLSGDIGSGKTSILLAIEYALFGLQPGQKGTSLLRQEKDLAEVQLLLEIKEKQVLIERRLKRTPRGVSNEYASITIDGEKTESSVTEIKNKVLQLLDYPQEFIKKNNLLYRYTVYTPQEQMKQIILEDPETRLNILRHIFGIDKYKKIRENSAILISKLKEESKFLEGELSNLGRERSLLEEKKSILLEINSKIDEQDLILEESTLKRKSIESKLLEIQDKLAERLNFQKELEKTQILINSKIDNISSLNKEILEIQQTLKENNKKFNQEEYQSLVSKISGLEEDISLLEKEKISLSGRIVSLESDQNSLLEKRQRIFKIDICPTCLQDVSENHKHVILNETESSLSKVKSEISNLKQKLESISFEIKEKTNLKKSIESEKLSLDILKSKTQYLEKIQSKLEQLTNSRSGLEEDLTLLEGHVLSLKENILNYEKFSRQEKTIQEELKLSFKEEKDSEIFLEKLKTRLNLTEKEISELEESILRKNKIQEELSYLLEIRDWISNDFLSLISFTERNVLMKLRVEFSKLFSEWFGILVPEQSLSVQLDESFTPIIIQGESEMEYSFLSGGERTAVALAYRLALNQTLNSLLSKIQTRNIVILDEPTEGFSSHQLDKMRDVLEQLSVQQLIVVSHEPKIESFVDNVIKIQKHADISEVINTNDLEENLPQTLNTTQTTL
jgi:exonuclease SbcC